MLLLFFLLDAAGLLPYMWILVSVVIVTGLLMILTCVMIILTAKRVKIIMYKISVITKSM